MNASAKTNTCGTVNQGSKSQGHILRFLPNRFNVFEIVPNFAPTNREMMAVLAVW